MKEYVVFPDALVADREALRGFFSLGGRLAA